MLIDSNGQIVNERDYVDELRLMCSLSDKSIPRGEQYGIPRITKGTSLTEYTDGIRMIMDKALSRLDSKFTYTSFDPKTSHITLQCNDNSILEVQYED